MIIERWGNLLADDAEALVNTVNTVGVMGKGIALQFKRAYPTMFADYARAVRAGQVRRGRMHVWAADALVGPRYIINFPTKGHWRSPSHLDDIAEGLEDLVRVVRDLEIRSIAIPPLGAGNGGLDWRDVAPLIRRAFAGEPVEVHLYEPGRAPAAREMVHRSDRPRMTPGRAALIAMLGRYVSVGLFASPIEVQKLMYFLQEAGQPLDLDFTAHHYGLYADRLRHVLIDIEGHYVTGYGDGSRPVDEAEPFELLPGAEEAAAAVLEQEAETRHRMDRVFELIAGFESTYGMELLSTVHWVLTRRDPSLGLTPSTLVDEVHRWSPRKQRMFSARHIEVAADALAERWSTIHGSSAPVPVPR